MISLLINVILPLNMSYLIQTMISSNTKCSLAYRYDLSKAVALKMYFVRHIVRYRHYLRFFYSPVILSVHHLNKIPYLFSSTDLHRFFVFPRRYESHISSAFDVVAWTSVGWIDLGEARIKSKATYRFEYLTRRSVTLDPPWTLIMRICRMVSFY